MSAAENTKLEIRIEKDKLQDSVSVERIPVDSKKSRSHMLLWMTLTLSILGTAWLLYWFLYLQFHQFTNDAYAKGNIVNINSAVPSSVVAFYADDTDFVTEGMLLVELDSTKYRVQYEKELAALASTVLDVSQIYDRVQVSQANTQSRQALLNATKSEYENRLSLLESKTISNDDLAHAKDDYDLAQSNLTQALRELRIAIDAAGTTSPENHPHIIEQKAKVRTAYYLLKHCSIYAPASGNIAQRTVEVGQWVRPGDNLMAIIPTDYVWVDANFKETQLTHMRIGQPTKVWFDIYGSKVIYEGKVLGIASGAGSVFSIIPPQNATGNWIKIVQRLPVRISLDAKTLKRYPTRLGISAEVDVDITNQDLPLVTNNPTPAQPIAKTQVFNLDFQEVDKIMLEIVQVNLAKHLLANEQ
jgi:membrane fusion protein (multidrug efflux system)